MKLKFSIAAAIFLFLAFCGVSSKAQVILQANGDKIPFDTAMVRSEKALKTLMEIIEIKEQPEYYKVARMMVYSGPDGTRDLVDVMDYGDPFDRLQVENTSNLLRHWIDKSTIQVFKNFRVIPGWKHDLYIWDVEFTNQRAKTKVRKFIFTLHGNSKFYFVRAEDY